MRTPSTILGKNLQYLRRRQGLTQKEIEYKLGFARTTWSNYELSISSPSHNGLILIAHYFQLRIEELLLTDLEARDDRIVHVHFFWNDSFYIVAGPEFKFLLNEINRLSTETKALLRRLARKKRRKRPRPPD